MNIPFSTTPTLHNRFDVDSGNYDFDPVTAVSKIHVANSLIHVTFVLQLVKVDYFFMKTLLER